MSLGRYLSNIPAALLGTVILPLRSIYLSLKAEVILLFIGLFAAGIMPISIALVLDEENFSLAANLAINFFLVIPITTTVVLAGLALVSTFIAVSGLLATLKAMWTGFVVGLTEGWEGIKNAYYNQQHPFSSIFLRIETAISGQPASEAVNNNEFQNLQQSQDIPVLETSAPKTKLTLLTSDELNSVSDLNQALSGLPLDFSTKEKFKLLKTRYDRYIDLNKKLDEVQTALKSSPRGSFEDEIVALEEVENTPILFVKQYKENNQWMAVHANSYVTEKERLMQWLEINATHPLTRDNIKNPSQYNGKPTRYIWHELAANDCYSQELGEGAEEIRSLCKQLYATLNTMNKGNKSSHGFYSSANQSSVIDINDAASPNCCKM